MESKTKKCNDSEYSLLKNTNDVFETSLHDGMKIEIDSELINQYYQDDDQSINRNTMHMRLLRYLLPTSIIESPLCDKLFHILSVNATSDSNIYIGDAVLIPGPEVVRFLKFFFWTMLIFLVLHPFARLMNWENDSNYSLSSFVTYDLQHMCLDVIAFFFIGRMFQKQGVDSLLPNLIPMIVGAIIPSLETYFSFLHHSVSMYEINCAWPLELFIFAIFLIILTLSIVCVHISYMYRHGILLSRLLEITASFVLLLVPIVSNPNFHFHHWFFSFLVGMHFNLDTWWSKCTQLYFWGNYINGIACWGRDPLLTCAYAFYASTDQQCDYMSCYTSDDNSTDGNGTDYKPFIAPTWWNCSADDNYIP